MMFPVLVILEVLVAADEDAPAPPVLLFREMGLPFAPTIGVSLFQEGWTSGPLVQVQWHETRQGFICYVAPDNSLLKEYESERDRMSQEDLIEWRVDLGWQRMGVGHARPAFLGPESKA